MVNMDGPREMDQLTREVRRNIDDNRKFLERIREDDFVPEGDEAVGEEEVFEEL